jgi:large subunit ribosomal protein L18
MRKLDDKTRRRLKRKASIRKRLNGTATRPRLTVYKSNRRTYVQAVDDATGTTLASASNLEQDLRGAKNVVKELGKLGERIAERLKAKSIEAVVFDRNGYPYHGKVKAVADGARKAGLKF